ncbi:DNA damage-inducible gene in SOS regulon,dependent on cyclic AMP and H-NS [Cronobacter condimenti 1330]|uniref:DNA damage-inducible gene in SOS regulon,dependent on cyclic AMP and H-NS n=1 Tax=Cronobacter condimenti 1330 TaxID=1073999 RepID=K8AHV7_9ENTR|nr:YebG family protein [Cronobacter condimenti]ALB63093.1 LexA family transcriptional regulator [Cronobacter condimenti 1330]CCJ73837.1 DNA damage-inducible gene in SOS regulon,dependent on cyclic AMP and H-NS [Cronobacter condimenti 1330]
MAVEIKYVVIREGVEKMSFASKKEADAWDKMLDLAEALEGWLAQSPVELAEGQTEKLALWMAEQKDNLSTIVRTGRLPQETSEQTDGEAKPAQDEPAESDEHAEGEEGAVALHTARKRTKAA